MNAQEFHEKAWIIALASCLIGSILIASLYALSSSHQSETFCANRNLTLISIDGQNWNATLNNFTMRKGDCVTIERKERGE